VRPGGAWQAVEALQPRAQLPLFMHGRDWRLEELQSVQIIGVWQYHII
jgi:hypothetical protein